MSRRLFALALVLVFVGCDQNPLRPSDEDNDPSNTNTQTIDIVVVIHNHPNDDDDDDADVPNSPPRLTSPGNQTSISGDVVSLQILATDADGDSLTYTAGGLPRDLTIDSATGVISGTLTTSSAADSPFSALVAVSDGKESDSVVFIWTVTAAAP